MQHGIVGHHRLLGLNNPRLRPTRTTDLPKAETPRPYQRAGGLVGRRRVLDSTPLYDAVTAMDTGVHDEHDGGVLGEDD